MKMIVCLMVSIVFRGMAFAEPTVKELKVTPIAPWGLAIDYNVCGAARGDVDMPLFVTVTNGNMIYVAQNLLGDIKWVNGTHRIYWDLARDGISANAESGNLSVLFSSYCVVDLSGGASAKKYSISYLNDEPEGGFNTSDYKTMKLVLKCLRPKAFIMGDDQSNESHRVTLTKPFYMGLFEVTQKQWELVMGSNPSSFKGDERPVEQVSYEMIRGSLEGIQWPVSNAVDADSFLGKLRARTGIDFDLPTEAQWEYACRAGTTTTYSYGDSADGDYMWYGNNSERQTHEVGTRKPNPWGFYDMHGNVWEWCLNRYGDLSYGTDPKGPSSGFSRVVHGGSWGGGASACASFYRHYTLLSYGHDFLGFRLARTLSD